MTIKISPLDLILDTQNPRFVVLENRNQEDIRKYLVTYEDVCQLSSDINNYGNLMPGERIVVLCENDKYTVIEGNRRTCSLQMLLSRDLIPNGFAHRIPHASTSIIQNCSTIEVDVLPNRNSALELMTKRHIQGVKEWKPLAKKQFFAANYKDGLGQSIQNLSKITGIRESEIKEDIKDYKFFSSVYKKYSSSHPNFNKEIIGLKTDPFWRIFKTKFEYPPGNKVSPKDFLKLSADDTYNTTSALPPALFEQITQLIFEKTIVQETITTRNTLTDVDGILPLLQLVLSCTKNFEDNRNYPDNVAQPPSNSVEQSSPDDTQKNADSSSQHRSFGTNQNGNNTSRNNADTTNGEPSPGGPAPKTFFETISWEDKLDPNNLEHQGLLCAINELFNLSKINCSRQKAYQTFPIASGMVLRTVYEQALQLRLKQVNLWAQCCKESKKDFPTLKTIENFINKNSHKSILFPERTLASAYDSIITNKEREFLNANIHSPGDIRVTPNALETISAGGMYSLIQGIINLID